MTAVNSGGGHPRGGGSRCSGSGGGASSLRRPENIVHHTANTSRPSAANASTTNNHIARTRLALTLGLATLAALAGCAGVPPRPATAPVEQREAGRPPPSPASPGPAASTTTPAATATVIERSRARWVAVPWAELPGWADDRAAELWPALQAGCSRPAPGWNELCARALLAPPSGDDATRQWLMTHLQPWRVESLDGQAEGLATGYYEPTLDAVRQPRPGWSVALHALPPALATRRPPPTRAQLDSSDAALLRGFELAWLQDPLDALLLQVQGSGRLRLTEADGRLRLLRLAFAGHNEHPFRSPGRWLIEQGELPADGVSWPAIKAWARLQTPQRLAEFLQANPRVVFFREEALPDPAVGPRGAIGVPLTPGRSVAVDPAAVPHGSVLWLDSTEPLSSQPLRRLVMAQDSGAAITGAVRIDLFFGWDTEAPILAGRMKQALRLWALWPAGSLPPGTRR